MVRIIQIKIGIGFCKCGSRFVYDDFFVDVKISMVA